MPSYHLNRRWTWGRRDASLLWREIMPFWALSFAGLVLSTIAVALTDSWLRGTHLGDPWRTLVIVAAHLSGFGLLWIAQFVLLERVLFAHRPAPLAATLTERSSRPPLPEDEALDERWTADDESDAA